MGSTLRFARMSFSVSITALVLLVGCATGGSGKPSPAITAAIASTDRPKEDIVRDAQRHPDAILAFFEVKPGMQVVDFIAGGGYYTELFSRVVGPTGKVYTTYLAPARIEGGRLANVTAMGDGPWTAITPGTIDLVFTAQNYHDIVGRNIPRGPILAQIKSVLKPGGIFAVSDHSAPDGSGTRDANTTHRIDEKVVRDEVTAAGFELVDETDVLRRPDDPRTARVTDPVIRGNTDQFVLKFRKP
jgi:predicted methyltransferase